jgi:hypothetical protein
MAALAALVQQASEDTCQVTLDHLGFRALFMAAGWAANPHGEWYSTRKGDPQNEEIDHHDGAGFPDAYSLLSVCGAAAMAGSFPSVVATSTSTAASPRLRMKA